MLSIDSLRSGHYELVPGFHTDRALLCSEYFNPPSIRQDMAELVRRMLATDPDINAVLCASVCGHIMAALAADAINTRETGPKARLVSAVFDAGGVPRLVSGFSLHSSDVVAIVYENVVGGARITPLADLAAAAGARVAVVAAILERRGGDFDPHVPVVCLLDMKDHSFPADTVHCRLCKEGVPVVYSRVA